MRFNLTSCIEKKCLLRGISCIEYAIGSKTRSQSTPILDQNLQPQDNAIDIKPVSARHFFQMARKQDHKGYMWILCVLNSNCNNKDCSSKNYTAKQCANTTNKVASKDYSKFMSIKPQYSRKNLLKQVPLKYHLIIEIFMKSNADIITEHKKK